MLRQMLRRYFFSAMFAVAAVVLISPVYTATLRTEDGLSLQFDNATGRVQRIKTGREELPLLSEVEGGFYLTDIGKTLASSKGAVNLLENPGFEESANAKGTPAGWLSYDKWRFGEIDRDVYRSGQSSLRVRASGVAHRHGVGAYQMLEYEKGMSYVFTAWVRSELQGTPAVMTVSCYGEGDKWLKAYYLRVTEPTDWKQKEIVVDASWIAEGTVEFRIGLWLEQKEGATGSAWFDDVRFSKLSLQSTILEGPLFCAGENRLLQTMEIPGQDIEVRVSYTSAQDYILVEGEICDHSDINGEHALELVYALPVNAAGWHWGDDIRTARVIEKGKSYNNTFQLAGHRISFYPFSSVTGEKAGLSLAVSMDDPVVQWAGYDTSEGFIIGFNLGLSPHTKKLGPGRASFSFLIYTHEPEWGFRASAKKYYEIFPQFFVRRTGKEGLWGRFAGGGGDLLKVPEIKDFGIGFVQVAFASDMLQNFFKKHDIVTAVCIEPTVKHLVLPEAKTRGDIVSLLPERFEQIKEWAKGDTGPEYWFLPWLFASWDKQVNRTPGGTASLRFSMPEQFTEEKPGPFAGGTAGGVVESIFIPVKPNTKYRFSVWGKIKGKEGSVFLRALDRKGSVIARKEDYSWIFYGWQTWRAGEDNWVNKEVEFVTEPNCTQLQVGIGMSGWGSFWVDDLVLVEVGSEKGNLVPNPGFEMPGRNRYRWGSVVQGLRAEVSKAILNSLPLSTSGEKMPGDADRYTFWRWRLKMNTNPDLPNPNIADIMKHKAYDILGRSQAAGVYLDSMQSGFAAYHNCRREHLELSDIPLTFDPVTKKPAILGTLSHCKFIKQIGDNLRGKDKLLFGNIAANSRYYVSHLDFYGGEVGSWGRLEARNLYEVESDAHANAKRTLAYQKWISNLLQEEDYRRLDETTAEPVSSGQIEQYIKHQMFYGIWPGISTIGGGSPRGYVQIKRYFSSPEFYERDRHLFQQYIPILRHITEAGWEPVTYAFTSDPAIWIERFGYLEKDNLYFTIRNSTPEERKAKITIQLAKLAAVGEMPNAEQLVAEIMVRKRQLTVSNKTKKNEVGFEVNIKGYDTIVVRLREAKP